MRRFRITNIGLAFCALLSAVVLHGQSRQAGAPEVTAELPPIVVSGTFELQRRPSLVDQFTRELTSQAEAKQKASEEKERNAFWSARFWNYLPRLLPTNDEEFLIPSYLDLANQHALRTLEIAEKHPLVDSPGR